MFGIKVTFKSLSAYPMKVQITRIFLALICITIFSCSSDNGVNPPGGGNSIDRIFIADINGESFAPNSITTSVSGGFITILGVMNSVQSNIEFELKIPEDVTPNVYRYDGTTWDAFLDVNNSSLGQNTYVPLEAEGDLDIVIHNKTDEYIEATFEFSAKNTADETLPLAEVANGTLKLFY
jgi:hypothetical protein